jgi:hypothetical protein
MKGRKKWVRGVPFRSGNSRSCSFAVFPEVRFPFVGMGIPIKAIDSAKETSTRQEGLIVSFLPSSR